MKYVSVIYILLSIGIFSNDLFAQFPNPVNSRPDSTAKKDTLYKPIPIIPLVGSIDRTLRKDQIITDSAMAFMDYKYLGDLVATFPGVYVQDLGSPGQLNGLNIDGVDQRSVAIMSNGVLMNEPLSGVYDANLYPTEQIKRIEMVPNTRAFLYGLNSTGGAINVVSEDGPAVKALSRIRFSQSAYDYTYFDGIFTQDVRRNLNVSIGLDHPSYGGRFFNNTYDLWSGRFSIRYNMSKDINIFASEVYNNTRLSLNGGDDSSTEAAIRFERYSVKLVDSTAYEKISRYDGQVGIGGRFLPDSTDLTSLIFFHSTSLREYRDDNVSIYSNVELVHEDNRSQWYGGRLTQHISIIDNSIDAGAEMQSRGVIASSVMSQHLATYTSIWGKDEISLVPKLDLAGYVRIDKNGSHKHLAYGADAAYATWFGVDFFGGYSHSYRDPTLEEEYWQDTIVTSNSSQRDNVETHDLKELGVRFDQDQLNFSLKYFHRVVENPSMTLPPTKLDPFPQVVFDFSGNNKLTIQGIDAKVSLKAGVIFGEGNFQYLQINENGNKMSELPSVSASGGIYYWDTLFGAHLNLKVGLRGRLISSHDGMSYNPQAQMYVPAYYWNVNSVGVGDFVLLAHLGDADIHILIENLFDRNYVVVPFFPMPDRALRFGVNWWFLN